MFIVICASPNYMSWVCVTRTSNPRHSKLYSLRLVAGNFKWLSLFSLLPLISESLATNAMGLMVLCQWSLSRGQDWTGVLPTPLHQLQLPHRGLSPRPTLWKWGTAWMQHRCRAAAAVEALTRGRFSTCSTPLPRHTSTLTGQSARPISCNICSRWCWRPCGSTSLPGLSTPQWTRSNSTCQWVFSLSTEFIEALKSIAECSNRTLDSTCSSVPAVRCSCHPNIQYSNGTTTTTFLIVKQCCHGFV